LKSSSKPLASSRNHKAINQALEEANSSFSLKQGSVDGFEKLLMMHATPKKRDSRESISKTFEVMDR
jgi:hypothetical protein